MNRLFAGALGAGAAALALHASVARADVTFSAFGGDLAASAHFAQSGGDLVITLTNTSPVDVDAPMDVLTALFFDVNGPALLLTPMSGVLGPGSTVLFDDPPPGGVGGGEWEYEDSFGAPAPHGAQYGISSAGFSLFGGGVMFPGPNLDPPPNVDGLNYGITSAGDNPLTGNAAVTGGNPLIQNQVVFTLSGLPDGFDFGRIKRVNFQYGTDLTEPNIPEPVSALLLGLGGMLALRRR
ncbi:MAG: XDD4 family exosortase-dependent surface protein [Phycisphaerae bacterium]